MQIREVVKFRLRVLAVGIVASVVLLLAILSWRTPVTTQPLIETTQAAVRAARVREVFNDTLRNLADAAPTLANERLRELELSLNHSSNTGSILGATAFLDSKSNAYTKLGFKIGPNHALTEVPSLRVFALDYLGRIDPRIAATYAERILASMDSADEWAIALRNYARFDNSSQAKTFLKLKLDQMLTHQPWLQNPSAGFLESFDVVVHLGATDLLPQLGKLARDKDNRGVSHAAFLTIDRLVIQNPAISLSILKEDRQMLDGREEMRGNLFARANPAHKQQRAIIEGYLLDPGLSSVELNAFANVFPNANYMVSNNLLTKTETPDGTTILQRDKAALEVVDVWLTEERFARLRPQLKRIRTRLVDFFQQARGTP